MPWSYLGECIDGTAAAISHRGTEISSSLCLCVSV
jgi:hypothetical protein